MDDEYEDEYLRLSVRNEVLFALRYGMNVPRDVMRAANEEHHRNRARMREIEDIRSKAGA